jgi:hypothetical protein
MRRVLVAVVVFAALAWGPPVVAQGPPAAQPAPPCSPTDPQFVCGAASAEDLVVLPGGEWVVASSYIGTGGINLIRASDKRVTLAYPTANAVERLDAKTYDTCPGPPDAGFKAKFQTHGLFLKEGRNRVHTLYVVAHGARESVEVFQVDATKDTPTFTWVGCAVAPGSIGLNSVHALEGGGFVATDFLARGIDAAGRGRMMAGEANGDLWEWHTGTGWRAVPGTRASGANGLAISPDAKVFYVAAWGSQSFFRVDRGQTPPKRDEVPLKFRVDNIRWASDGTILAAGQAGVGGSDTPATVVVKVDPKTLAVREVLRRPNDAAFANGTVAVEVGRSWWIGTFRGDRILVAPTKP